MGKGAIKRQGASKHSRAARRASSPGIDADKSLKKIGLPDQGFNYRPAVLAVHSAAGISKKTKRKSIMSHKARKRHEKALDRAEAIAERTVLKVEKSKGQAKTIQARRKDWEDINKRATTKKTTAFNILSNDHYIEKQSSESAELDDEMEEAGEHGPQPAFDQGNEVLQTAAVDGKEELL